MRWIYMPLSPAFRMAEGGHPISALILCGTCLALTAKMTSTPQRRPFGAAFLCC